jgi:hypothetical protein
MKTIPISTNIAHSLESKSSIELSISPTLHHSMKNSNSSYLTNRCPQVAVINSCTSVGTCNNDLYGIQYTKQVQLRARKACRFLNCIPVVQSLTARLAILRIRNTKSELFPLLSKQQKVSATRPDILGMSKSSLGIGAGCTEQSTEELRERMRVEKINRFCSFYLSIIKVVKEQYQVTSSTLSDGLQCFLYNRSSWGFPRSVTMQVV